MSLPITADRGRSGSLVFACLAVAGLAVLVLGVGAFLGFFLLIALNGFSESDAMPILVGFGLCVLATTALASFGASALVLRRHPRRVVVSLGLAGVVTLLPVVASVGWYVLRGLAVRRSYLRRSYLRRSYQCLRL